MKRFFVLLMVFAASSSAFAEPSPTVRYLMNEPVTMLEWGLYNLGKRVQGFRNFEGFDLFTSSAMYNWETNRIVLILSIIPRSASLKKIPAMEICKQATQDIRLRFLSRGDDRTRALFGISRFFEHEGFKSTKEPKNFMEEIENITNIRIHVVKEPDFATLSECESPYRGEEVFIIEK